MIEKYYISADEFQRDNWRLASAVRRGEWQPDYILGLWRGGAPVAITVHEFFKVTGWDVRHIPLKCSSYTGIGENHGNVEFTHGDIVFGMFRKGDKVLVIDDVFDTGKTAAAIKKKMDSINVDMRMACTYWKPEKNITEMKPDYFVKDVGETWIVFPHEIAGLTPEEIITKDSELADLLTLRG